MHAEHEIHVRGGNVVNGVWETLKLFSYLWIPNLISRMSTDLLFLIILFSLFIPCPSHPPPANCPGTDECSGQYFDTLRLLKQNKLDCRNFGRYLACLEDKVVQCHDSVHDNATDNSPDNHTYPDHHDHHEEGDVLPEMKEARVALCDRVENGVINIPSNYSKLFLSFNNDTRKYASFDYYPFVHHNLSMRTGCDVLANCTLILTPYAQFSEEYFPCSALLEFEDCFHLYQADCPDMDNLPSLSSSVDSIDKECQVDTSPQITWSLLLMIISLMVTC